MKKLPEVEQAKALMADAMGWSVMKWLREKKEVRRAADLANAALDQMEEKTKARWNNGLQAAYASLADPPAARGEADPPAGRKADRGGGGKSAAEAATRVGGDMLLMAKKIKAADGEAGRARMEAEKTFDDAEKQLSTSMAREGCRKAIHSWELHEKAIALAESAV